MSGSLPEKYRYVIFDVMAVNLAWAGYYWFRVRSGWLSYVTEPDFWIPMVAVCLYWLTIFFFFGLYRSWYAKSRLDELAALFKATVFGSLLLFFAIFVDDKGGGSPLHRRLLIVIYSAFVYVAVGGGRLLLHTFQRQLLEAGIGLHNTLIVGWAARAKELFDRVERYPALGYKVVGFVPVTPEPVHDAYRGVPVLAPVQHMPELIDRHGVKDVLIALDSTDHDKLLDVIARCNGHDVSLKITPDLYDIISGQARTNQIYGFPLIEIMPALMQPWERVSKRIIDIAVSSMVLLFGLPVWIVVALLIRLESPGPVFYTQERVGKDERRFRIIKFRSMRQDAELQSGPVWSNKKDPRITKVGNLLRRARLDEFPQLINVLDGDMSLVGPRPERPFFVEQLAAEIPLYKRRLKVRPGVTGWAQVRHKYDESIEDVRKKVEYDLYYIENMSLRMDLKILVSTISVVFLGKGR